MNEVWTLTRFFAIFVILLGWSVSYPPRLWAQESCTITQLTDSSVGENYLEAINADGTRLVVFSSRPDQQFESNRVISLLDTTTNALTQVAELGEPCSVKTAISGDGTRIVFYFSATDLIGFPDSGQEIFLFDAPTNTLTQLTDGSNQDPRRDDSFDPDINADGTRIVFSSELDLTGQNPDGNGEIFLFDTITNMFTQLTASPDSNGDDPAINADGTRIAFESRSDLTGENPDGNNEIFLFDTTTNSLTQLTFTAESFGSFPNEFPTINSDGTRIAFESRADPTGQNLDGNNEVFLIDTTTNTLTQLTDSPDRDSSGPTINAGGTRIAFDSTADLAGENPDGNNEIFLFDTTTQTLIQLTKTVSPSTFSTFGPEINADGTRIAFSSEENLTGQNPDGGSEVFLADCSPTSLQGVLENPQPNSFQSGIGVISGWVCSASVIEIEFDGGARFEAAYGTSRGDTQDVCGDANNGFSLLFNWNLLGDGAHTGRVLADGGEVASVTVTVTTLGLGEFPTGLSGTFTLMDFPAAGKATNLQWQQSQQNFVIVSGSASEGGNSGSGEQVLENPQPGSFQSGIGVLSGFVCEATLIEMSFNGGPRFAAAYGTSRGDTAGICGDANNGFSLLFNWNLLGDGVHTVQAFADDVEFANVTITVTTLGLGEFPTGLSGMFTLPDFPAVGDATNVQWQQSQQNFVIVDVQ